MMTSNEVTGCAMYISFLDLAYHMERAYASGVGFRL